MFLTGHTGFKGSWLAQWLLTLGAEVHGYALDPQEDQPLFGQLGLAQHLSSDTRADVSDRTSLGTAINAAIPDIVFHLAAQPLVRLSYQQPVETFATNVMGTAHLLEAVASADRPCTVVCITTDKCYENREWLHAYRETDALGGHDPYSASKAAAEMVIASYRQSFFSGHPPAPKIRLASARAGNVIGGGDWGKDRIVPDSIRHLRQGEPIQVRHKAATRPWQHVLEPLSGYLRLAEAMACASDASSIGQLTSAFNFGPDIAANRSVVELVEELLLHLPGNWEDASDTAAVHEASKLNLATEKAFHLLEWRPLWDFARTVEATAAWYRSEASGAGMREFTLRQIAEYEMQREGAVGKTHG